LRPLSAKQKINQALRSPCLRGENCFSKTLSGSTFKPPLRGVVVDLSFWKTASGGEVDFIWNDILIEVKAGEFTGPPAPCASFLYGGHRHKKSAYFEQEPGGAPYQQGKGDHLFPIRSFKMIPAYYP
jgi:hypothetical protein